MNYFKRWNQFSPHAHRISIVLLTAMILASIFGVFVSRGLNTEYSINQFLDPKNPLLISEFKVRDDFILPTWPYVYVTMTLHQNEKSDFLLSDLIQSLRRGTEEVAAIPGVRRVVDIANVEGASAVKNGDITVGKVLDLTPKKVWHDRVLKDPLLSPSLISNDARTILVAVELEDFNTQVMSPLPDHLRKTFLNYFPNASVQIGGIPAIQSEMAKLLKSELIHFIALALLACLLTLGIFFKDKPSLLVPILLVGFANIAVLSWMVIANIPFTVLSTTLPVLVSIIVLSISTHTMINFSDNWEQGLKIHEPNLTPSKMKLHALLKTMRSLFLPNFLTALTTSLGFAALLTTKVPMIRDYAKCVSVGVLIAWVCVTVALPPLLVLIPVPRPRSWTASKARWALHVEKNKKRIVLAVMVLAILLAWEGRGLNWAARLFDDLPKEREARQTSEWIDQKLGAIIPLDLVVRSNEPESWNDPDRVLKLKTLIAQIRKMDGVGSVMGFSDLIEAGSRAQNIQLPSTRAGVAEMIFLYSLSPEHVTQQYLTSDGTQTRVSIRVRDIPADQMETLVNSIHSSAQIAFPGLEVQTVGMAANVHLINKELCKGLIFGFWQAILLISLVLVIVFRSFKWTIAAMLPNLMSPIALTGVMALTHTVIKPGIALIFSIALGIAYNNTVYLLGRVRLLRMKSEARGKVEENLPVTKAWYQEGNPCVFSTLALVGGFAVFMASYFPLTRIFGAYMLLSILAGMLGDLVFLPALLTWFPGLLRKRKRHHPVEV